MFKGIKTQPVFFAALGMLFFLNASILEGSGKKPPPIPIQYSFSNLTPGNPIYMDNGTFHHPVITEISGGGQIERTGYHVSGSIAVRFSSILQKWQGPVVGENELTVVLGINSEPVSDYNGWQHYRMAVTMTEGRDKRNKESYRPNIIEAIFAQNVRTGKQWLFVTEKTPPGVVNRFTHAFWRFELD